RQVEKTRFKVLADEMDYLGFYLSHGLRFDMDDFTGMDSVGISGFSEEVDRWVFERFELGQNTTAPRFAESKEFSEFLADIEQAGDDYRTDCAFALLDLSSAGRGQFMDMVVRTKEQSRKDLGLHSFSMGLAERKRGISFLSFNAGT